MAATPSTMVALGTPIPTFRLPDTNPLTNDGPLGADRYLGRPVLVMFICNHCPFVKHIAAELAAIGRDYGDRVGVVAISSNDAETHPDDAPPRMTEECATQGYTFPYLYDETQETARAFDAACTPDFFLYDNAHRLAYRGQLDDSRPNSGVPVTGRDLRAALDAVLAGTPAPEPQAPSIGCNIKWREH